MRSWIARLPLLAAVVAGSSVAAFASPPVGVAAVASSGPSAYSAPCVGEVAPQAVAPGQFSAPGPLSPPSFLSPPGLLSGPVTLCVSHADLAVALRGSADPVHVGEVLLYEITVTNKGPNEAANATVVDVVPKAAKVLSATWDSGRCRPVTKRRWHCDLGTLRLGLQVVVTVRVVFTEPGIATDVARVGTDSWDGVPENDHASLTSHVLPARTGGGGAPAGRTGMGLP